MLDTLKAYLEPEHYRLGDTSAMTVQTTKSPDREQSTKVFYNSYGGHFAIEQDSKKRGLLFFRADLPSILHGSSLRELSESDYENAHHVIVNEMHSAGIDFNDSLGLPDFKLSRVDFCKNVVVEKEMQNYAQAFCNLDMSRRKRNAFGNTWQNKSIEFSIYDKVKCEQDKAESRDERESLKGLPCNILRLETRLKNRQKVKAVLSPETKIPSLFNKTLSLRLITNEFEALVKDDKAEQMIFDFEKAEQSIKKLKALGYREVLVWFLAMQGGSIASLFKACNYNDKKLREWIVKSEACNRQHSYKLLHDLRAMLSLEYSDIDRGALFQEVREKLSA